MASGSVEEEDPVVYDHVGDTYAKMNSPEEALAFWRKAAALNKTDEKIAAKIRAAKGDAAMIPNAAVSGQE